MKDLKPLPMSNTLHDLALLRVSDVELSTLLSGSVPGKYVPAKSSDKMAIDAAVELSYTFTDEARKALKILNTGAVEIQGARVDDSRAKLEEALQGFAS